MMEQVEILLNGSKRMVDKQNTYEGLCRAASHEPKVRPTVAVMPLYAKSYTLLPEQSCELQHGMSVHVHRTGNA